LIVKTAYLKILAAMNSLFEKAKALLSGVHPVYVVGGAVFIIYLLERHIYLAGVVIFGSVVAVVFKKYGVIVLSVLADFADYMGAAVPIVGDFLDIFIVIIQSLKYGAQGFVGLFELIPFVDLLPILAVNAAFAEYKNKKNSL
jgi:hypothetical protein